MKKVTVLLCSILLLSLQSCGIYSFTGANTGDAESFQVNFFQNQADLVEPGIDRLFTLSLQDLIQNQTNLSLANENADLIFEGEIVDYYIAPMTSTANNTAAQNRLTIAINVRFYNTLEPEKDFERVFSFYYDYDGSTQLVGGDLETALDEIYTRITQDVFNAALTDW
ncbi:LptE family protein [Salegentibacter sp. F188]|uniref:LptE family protein n=1 Tax=Autumnicola patrickiae TaxID=3075591 RepID=A0ABU3E608_9FLAO|nr:LptE family protein [Salegentibacter sp. F188]MDT0691436.1 LptE family protein [Salegentibacter sp. F188]